jgi:hypothetical protein
VFAINQNFIRTIKIPEPEFRAKLGNLCGQKLKTTTRHVNLALAAGERLR